MRTGTTIEAEISGASSDEAVVLIAGAGAPLQFWDDGFVERLAAGGRTVVRYCHRDTGLSDHFDEPYGADALLADLRALVDHVGASRVHAIGHSMGGYLACMEAANRPGAFASVCAISAGPARDPERLTELGVDEPSEETWEILMRNQPVGNFEEDLPGWMASWSFLAGTRSFDEPAAVAYTQSLYRGDPRNHQVAENHIEAMSGLPKDLPEKLAAMNVPLLVMHGGVDPLVTPANGRALARIVAGAKYTELPGVGHMFFGSEVWNCLAEALERWLADLAPPTRAL